MSSRRRVAKERLQISNPDKVLYPAGKFTKADVLSYYERVAPFLLPHFRNRPVTLKRYPNGVFGEAFYEKDAPGFTPRWIKTFPVPRREGGPDINYILINDVRTLKWAANMAALELHPFLHRVPRIERPTHVVFDLDPGEETNILQCAEVAFLLRDVLMELRLKSFAKVSGSKGIQLYVPLNTGVTYETTQPFARAIAEVLEKGHPDKIVADMAKNLRVGKVFIDWSQNADHKTTVGVYSLRAKRARPYVSMPVKWEELTTALKKADADLFEYEAEEALHRLKRVGDLFAPLLKLKQKLPKEFASLRKKRPRRKTPAALADYRVKRDFTRTAEPVPALPRSSAQGSRRRFVVQKHAASHLHYDFRLEMHDVLKSWAVPKGIPLKNGETRTGFETEDHPIDYLQFEGIIPEGQYGGGTVMVWDIGTYEPLEGNFWKGALTIFLSGKKLKGEWTVRRADSENGKPRWLIIKTGGDAKPISKRRESVSALTGRTMDKIAGEQSAVWHSNRGAAPEKKPARVKEPRYVKPMKATAVAELPVGDEWIYEIKWDGYRSLALKHGDSVRLLSLKEKSLTSDFHDVVAALHDIRADTAILDGEIVAIDAQGRPSFQVLQNRKSLGRGWNIVYYAFDLIQLEGDNLFSLPLHERKAKLKEIIAGTEVRYSAELEASPDVLIETVHRAGLEGVIAKRRDSPYRAGTRVTSWLKFKLNKAQEFVIGGYKPDGDSFQSILPGFYERKKLIFCGKVRQGFNPAVRTRLMKEMRSLQIKKCPFSNLPTSRKSHFGEGITADEMTQLRWLKPKLIAQVSFTEWTTYGMLRHATFEGLRDDKEPHEIVREAQ